MDSSAVGRPAPPIGPVPLRRAPPPIRTTNGHKLESDEQELIIPPQYKTACIVGFAIQAMMDILALLVVRYTRGAFFTIPVAGLCLALDGTLLVWTIMAKPLPIDVLMKNALSGVAWFMLCVINGIIISDTKNPYSFIVCTAIMVFNLCFWVWTLWWGLNDRHSRSMFRRKTERRCSASRAGASADKHSGLCCRTKDCESGFAMQPIAVPPRAQLSMQRNGSPNQKNSEDEPTKEHEDKTPSKPVTSYDRHGSCIPRRQSYIPDRDSYISRPDGYTPRPDSFVPRQNRSTSFASTNKTEHALLQGHERRPTGS